jgi:hypothetical protein
MQQQISITKAGRVFLHLPGKDYKENRCIGVLTGDTLFVQRDPERHFFRKNQSYGFNYEAIRSINFRRLVVELPLGQRLETTKEFLLAHGTFLHFQRNLLERQIFLSIDRYGMDKALEWQRDKNASTPKETKHEPCQTDLFRSKPVN